MTNRFSTKRALLASVLSLLLCLSMLAGITFAWFSDTASANVNKIQGGTLDVGLEVSYDDGETWDNAEGKTINFVAKDGNEEILWEPGCTYELPMLRVVNNGDLALQFRIAITGIDGNAKLNEVIDWKYSYKAGEGVSYYKNTDGGRIFGLSAGGNMPFVISGHMQETAGNEYQGLCIEGISITVLATQLPAEYDSFNNTYDENADGTPDLLGYIATVNDSESFVEELKKAAVDTVIYVAAGEYTVDEKIATYGTIAIAEGADVEINFAEGAGIVINASKNEDEVKINAPAVLNGGNLTINGGVIENKNAIANHYNVAAVKNVGGLLTLNNCTIKNVAPTSGGDYAVTVTGGKLVMNNCTVDGYRGGISVSGDGAIEMNGGSVKAGVYYPMYLTGTGASTFENVTFTKANNSKGKAITYNCFNEGEGTVTFTACTFTTERSGEIAFDIYGNTTGITFNGCTFTKVTNPTA